MFYLSDHLDYLVHTKRLSEILNIIPMKYFGDGATEMIANSQIDNDNDSNGKKKLFCCWVLKTRIYCESKKMISFIFSITADASLDKNKIFSMENNNNAIFTAFLKSAIDTDRSERLNEMIKTTGFQLYNTFIGGNNPVADN